MAPKTKPRTATKATAKAKAKAGSGGRKQKAANDGSAALDLSEPIETVAKQKTPTEVRNENCKAIEANIARNACNSAIYTELVEQPEQELKSIEVLYDYESAVAPTIEEGGLMTGHDKQHFKDTMEASDCYGPVAVPLTWFSAFVLCNARSEIEQDENSGRCCRIRNTFLDSCQSRKLFFVLAKTLNTKCYAVFHQMKNAPLLGRQSKS